VELKGMSNEEFANQAKPAAPIEEEGFKKNEKKFFETIPEVEPLDAAEAKAQAKERAREAPEKAAGPTRALTGTRDEMRRELNRLWDEFTAEMSPAPKYEVTGDTLASVKKAKKKTLSAEVKNERKVYRELGRQGSAEKLDTKTLAELETIEAKERFTDAEYEKMKTGEAPWKMNAVWRAMGEMDSDRFKAPAEKPREAPKESKTKAVVETAVVGAAVAGAVVAAEAGKSKAAEAAEAPAEKIEAAPAAAEMTREDALMLKMLETTFDDLADQEETARADLAALTDAAGSKKIGERKAKLEGMLELLAKIDQENASAEDKAKAPAAYFDEVKKLYEGFADNVQKVNFLEFALKNAIDTLNKKQAELLDKMHAAGKEIEEFEKTRGALPRGKTETAPTPSEQAKLEVEMKAAVKKISELDAAIAELKAEEDPDVKRENVTQLIELTLERDEARRELTELQKRRDEMIAKAKAEAIAKQKGPEPAPTAAAATISAEERARMLAEAKARFSEPAKAGAAEAPPSPDEVVMPDMEGPVTPAVAAPDAAASSSLTRFGALRAKAKSTPAAAAERARMLAEAKALLGKPLGEPMAAEPPSPDEVVMPDMEGPVTPAVTAKGTEAGKKKATAAEIMAKLGDDLAEKQKALMGKIETTKLGEFEAQLAVVQSFKDKPSLVREQLMKKPEDFGLSREDDIGKLSDAQIEAFRSRLEAYTRTRIALKKESAPAVTATVEAAPPAPAAAAETRVDPLAEKRKETAAIMKGAREVIQTTAAKLAQADFTPLQIDAMAQLVRTIDMTKDIAEIKTNLTSAENLAEGEKPYLTAEEADKLGPNDILALRNEIKAMYGAEVRKRDAESAKEKERAQKVKQAIEKGVSLANEWTADDSISDRIAFNQETIARENLKISASEMEQKNFDERMAVGPDELWNDVATTLQIDDETRKLFTEDDWARATAAYSENWKRIVKKMKAAEVKNEPVPAEAPPASAPAKPGKKKAEVKTVSPEEKAQAAAMKERMDALKNVNRELGLNISEDDKKGMSDEQYELIAVAFAEYNKKKQAKPLAKPALQKEYKAEILKLLGE
jgi:hypothetical protein